jgi:hypothetical protein
MWTVPKQFSVRLGGNTYIDTPNLIVYKDEALFQIYRSDDNGILAIDFDVYDANRKKIAVFAKGIVAYGDASNYIVTTGHDEYTVREKDTNQLIASVKRRNVEGAELDVTVRLYLPNGVLLDATPTHTNIGTNTFVGCTFRGGKAAISIG